MKNADFQQLNIAFTEHGKVWCFCPMHNDTIRPNLSISLLDKYYGRYKCWACSAEGYLSKEQMDKLNLSESTVYKNNIKSLHTLWAQHTQSCYVNLQKYPLLKLGLAKELDISTKSLDDWQVGYDGNAFTIPMFREDLPEYNRERGFCGIQRRFPDSSKRCVTGSHLGLMYPHARISDYYIFICEGFSDGISVWDLGLQSITRPHCRYIDGIYRFLDEVIGSVERIIIIPDNDTVGREGAEQLQNELDGLYYEDEEWEGDEEVDITIFSFDGAKDIRGYIKLKGKEVVRKELLRLI